MLDFICMGPVDLRGARRKRQNTKWKGPCPQWDSNPQPFDSKSDALPNELAGLGECCPFKWPYYIHVQWWFVNPDTFVPGRYFRINEFSGLLNRPSVQKRKSVPALFVRISEISGLSEPGLTNHVLPIPMFTLLYKMYVPEWWSRA